MTYVATFFSHFDALSFSRMLHKKNIASKLMPVPRSLSSSCGTCVKFKTDLPVSQFEDQEVDRIILVDDDK